MAEAVATVSFCLPHPVQLLHPFSLPPARTLGYSLDLVAPGGLRTSSLQSHAATK